MSVARPQDRGDHLGQDEPASAHHPHGALSSPVGLGVRNLESTGLLNSYHSYYSA